MSHSLYCHIKDVKCSSIIGSRYCLEHITVLLKIRFYLSNASGLYSIKHGIPEGIIFKYQEKLVIVLYVIF